MVASKFNLIVLIILSLQLCGAILLCNGMSMTLHPRRFLRGGIRVKEPLVPYDSTFNTSYLFMEYYIKLSVGTPGQDLLLIMDTGSSVVWAPCTPNYTCIFPCPGYTTVFLPRKSSSALPVECADPKCIDVCYEDGTTCPDKCSGTCPDYLLLYGSGSANGYLLTDTLTLPSGSGQITKFGFGCSVTSVGDGNFPCARRRPAAGKAPGQQSTAQKTTTANQNPRSHIAPPIRVKWFPCIELRCNWELTAVQALMLA